jgi:F0F1-type ATP synthase delta subunit
MQVLRECDWGESPIYHQFQRNGHWKHEDPTIFSDVELKYLHSMLRGMTSKENTKEFHATEGKEIIEEHFAKVMKTLEILMNQVNLMYYYERLRAFFQREDPDLNQLLKLTGRCLKLYVMIDNFTKIFKLMTVKDRIELKLVASPSDAKLLDLDAKMNRRLQVAIKLLLKENPVLPTGFKFNGICLLEKYKR